MGSTKKVFIAMSGGVDSSAAAALLLQEGYDCSGMFMITNDQAAGAQADAEEVCKHLGIELHVVDFREDFEHVIGYFCDEYKHGRTPNPCVFCNVYIKFGKLWQYAKEHGGDFIATGHYGQVLRRNGRAGIYESDNIAKDQSYVLSMIDRDIQEHIILPVGTRDKSETRRIAAEFGLHIEQKADSQEICFIPDDDYIGLLEKRCPELKNDGQILDIEGDILGTHQGCHRFTIGQRRGLKIAMGRPVFVIAIDSAENTVTLGDKEHLMKDSLIAGSFNWLIEVPADAVKCKVKIRYNHRGQTGTIRPMDDNKVLVEFDTPVSAVTPGQAAVAYVEEDGLWRLAGGGWIEK